MTNKRNHDKWMRHVLSKMLEQQIAAFTDEEIARVFAGCVSERKLTEAAHALIEQGKLTEAMVVGQAAQADVVYGRLDGTVRPCVDCPNGVWVTVDGRTEHYQTSEVNGFPSLMSKLETGCIPF